MHTLLNFFTTAALTVLLFAACPPDPVSANVGNDLSISQVAASLGKSPTPAISLTGLQAMALGVSEMPTLPDTGNRRYRMVDAGGPTTCAIRSGGNAIECFGFNQLGQANPPKGRFKSLSMGEFHGCAISPAGKLSCWGHADAYPKPGEAIKKYRQVSAGSDHTCARTTQGELNCWGNNAFGELNVPPGRYIDVSAKSDHTCAIDKANNLSCWGEKAFTSHGPFTGQYTNVSTGDLHVCALRLSDKRAVCWGNNAYGQASPPLDEFISLTSGAHHTCGQRPDRTVACWGQNQYGEAAADGRRYAQVGAGGNMTCMLTQGSQKLNCLGSFAFNDSLFRPNDQALPSGQAGLAKPTAAYEAYGAGVDWFGNAISTGLELFFSDAANWAKWTMGFGSIGGGLAAFLLSSIFGQEDPTLEMLDKIKDQLDEIQASIHQVSKSIDQLNIMLGSANYMIAASWCDDSLTVLENAIDLFENGNTFTGARQEWRDIMDDYSKSLNLAEKAKLDSVENKTPLDPQLFNQELAASLARVEAYKAKWLSPSNVGVNLERTRSKLSAWLLGPTKTSPLTACRAKSYQAWKSSPQLYPFDDRPIWSESYKVFIKTQLLQAEIATIETQVNSMDIVRVLLGPAQSPDGSPVPPFEWVPEDEAPGLCTLTKQTFESGAAGANQRVKDAWQKGREPGPCQKHQSIVRRIYLDVLKQFEAMGGAYSDDHVVLSMTSAQMGQLPVAGQSNWLWLRDADKGAVREAYSDMAEAFREYIYSVRSSQYGYKADASPFAGVISAALDGKNDAGLYLQPVGVEQTKTFGEFVWHSNGEAWRDAFRARSDAKAASTYPKEKENYEDFMEKLAGLKDPIKSCQPDSKGNNPCYKKIEDPNNPPEVITVFEPGAGVPAFKGVSKKPFWMILPYKGYLSQHQGKPVLKPQEFNLLYKSIDNTTTVSPNRSSFPCFVAESINSPLKLSDNSLDKGAFIHQTNPLDDTIIDRSKREYLKLSGKVCGGAEVATLLRSNNNNLRWIDGIDCRGRDHCYGLGRDFAFNENFDAYKEYFGGSDYRMIYQMPTSATGGMFFSWEWDTERSRSKMNLYHLPVVKITGRPCNYQLYASNIDQIWNGATKENPVYNLREATRDAGDAKTRLPSICGADLDTLIARNLKRPPLGIEMPGIRTLSTQ